MSARRLLPRPGDIPPGLRRRASDLINGAWEWTCALGMVGPDDARGRRFRQMGFGSGLAFPRGDVFGEAWISIGEGTLIAPRVSLSAGMPGVDLDPSSPPVITIGSRCSIGRGSSIVGLGSITIESDVTVAPYVYVTDHNHNYESLDRPVHRQWPSEDPVAIGAGSWIGTGVVVLPGARIGRHVTVGAGSVVRGVIPDNSVVAGSPARLLRHYEPERGWQPPLPDRTVRTPRGWDD